MPFVFTADTKEAAIDPGENPVLLAHFLPTYSAYHISLLHLSGSALPIWKE